MQLHVLHARSALYQWIGLLLLLSIGISPVAGLAALNNAQANGEQSHHAAQSNTVDFSDNYERIFQIRVVSKDAGGKSSIGSGFQLSADGLIVTNYHVVSDYVNSPDNAEIIYATHDGQTGRLTLLDFDIINDLAVLRHPNPSDDYFKLASRNPVKGEYAYALGNPGDWGIVMVPGPTNGLVEHSIEERILFSGSLNPGMSGGPSLNEAGDVIGVNVATAGSQLSFLVSIKNVERLLNKQRHLDTSSYQAEMAQQMKLWQQPRIQALIDSPWSVEDFNGRQLFGEIRKDIQCWGSTNESNTERTIARVRKSCRAGDEVYIAGHLNAGQIMFSFTEKESVKLNRFQFAKVQSDYMVEDNDSDYESSTNFMCETDFIHEANDSDGYSRIVSCVRAFKKWPGLYDSMLMVQTNKHGKLFETYLGVSAVERDQILALNKRFIEETR